MATKTSTKKATKRSAKKGTRKWRSLTPDMVSAGRKELRKLTKAGNEQGYISKFAQEHNITNVTAFLALRGRTYRYLQTPGVMIDGKPAKVERVKTA